jgi:hypothetical protein
VPARRCRKFLPGGLPSGEDGHACALPAC